MKKRFTINITMETDTAIITDLDITEGMYNRTEFVTDGVDSPMSINETVNAIKDELINAL